MASGFSQFSNSTFGGSKRANDEKKVEEKRKKRIYSTSRIEDILKDLKKGYEADMTPFFENDITLRSANLTFKMTDEEYDKWVYYSANPVDFTEREVVFLNDKGRTLVKLRDYQKEYLHLVGDEVYDEDLGEFLPLNNKIVALQSRQSSKTTSTVSYLLWYLCFHTDRNILIVANKGETSAEITKKLKDSYKELPFYLKPGIVVWNQKKITLDNGCTLTCKTTNKTSATGDTIHVLYFDEVAKLPANISDEFWMSIYPTMSSSRVSQIILTSTPDGKENLFYRIWDGSQKGTNDFIGFRVDWWQVPGHDEEWAEEQRRNFGDVEFEQEFGLSFDTSSTKLISGMDSKFFDKIKKEFKNANLSMFTKEENQRLYWHPDYSPIFQSNEGYYLFVVDTAEGKEEGVKGKKDSDYNIINIFRVQMNSIASIRKKLVKKHKIEIEDCFRLFQVGIYIDNDNDEEASAEVLKKLVFELYKCGSGTTDNCRVLVEMNFNGKNFVNKFINHKNYDEGIIIKTYHTKPIPGERQRKKMGFKTTGGKHGKNYYCELGAKKIAERQIIVSQYDKKDNISTLGQINNFAKGKNGSYAGVAMHDDIAVTVLFSWRAFEEEEFLEWLQQYLDEEIESCKQKDYIKYCLRMFNEDEPEMNDTQFTDSYLGGSGGGFNSGYSRFSPRPVSPYSSQFGRVGGAQTYGSLIKNR